MAQEQAMATPRRIRYRADDLWDMPDDGKIYEIIDGELYVSPTPAEPHQRALMNLAGYLWQHVRARKLGRVYVAPFAVVLGPDTALEPDLIYLTAEHEDRVSHRGVESSPDLVVEILSPSTRRRDLDLKRRRYARAGIGDYWIVVPDARTLQALHLEGAEYSAVGTFGPGSVFRPDLFPGLEIPIDDLWS
jgi:Uma2 family endonuclease